MTGSTLYEAVEPHALWSRLLDVVLSDLISKRANSEVSSGERNSDVVLTGSVQGCAMVQYLLQTFHAHDEEIETIHLPVVFSAIAGVITVSRSPASKACT